MLQQEYMYLTDPYCPSNAGSSLNTQLLFLLQKTSYCPSNAGSSFKKQVTSSDAGGAKGTTSIIWCRAPVVDSEDSLGGLFCNELPWPQTLALKVPVCLQKFPAPETTQHRKFPFFACEARSLLRTERTSRRSSSDK